MPIYGYRCKTCNHTFEVIQSVNDEPVKNCPKCENPVSKVFFPVGITFKGSGFYSTDYKPSSVRREKEAVSENGNGGKSDNGNSAGCSGCTTCPSVATNNDN